MSKVRSKEGLNGYQPSLQPQGLETISKLCGQLYPDQPNPIQVTALVKYWLGGPDPLDYITIYQNSAANTDGSATPPYWHYVSCGFSDLHGDGRVHECAPSPEHASGFGFELTFRLRGYSPSETSPPTWPAELLQSLARYVFSSGNMLCEGDHISWHSPLDQQESRIQHMLLAPDPQLPAAKSALGSLHFIQIVGVTVEEVSAAQAWNAMGIIKLLRANPMCGGHLLVTDMRRGESLFELMPDSRAVVDEGVELEGSLLSGVSALCWWESEPHSATSAESELCQTAVLEKVHLTFNTEALQLWRLAVKGRLNHGRHFTFRGLHGDQAITFVSDGIEGALATNECPLVVRGPWLHVYLSKHGGETILKDLDQLLKLPSGPEQLSLPLTLEWRALNLKVTVIASDHKTM